MLSSCKLTEEQILQTQLCASHLPECNSISQLIFILHFKHNNGFCRPTKKQSTPT